ncbi:glycine-rich protein DC7.1-like [Apium graveolens]|uniref:glycine-rich protein DC7.1-like n=1 Tax=Apium graveolens TaxID=4045 RepID=UPI003D799000
MGSKIFLLLGLSIALALLISSEVAARDLAESETTTQPEGYHGGGYNNRGGGYRGGGGGRYNGGGGYRNGGGGYRNGGGHRGGSCYHYCHGRCCSAAEEAALKATEVEPQN